MCEWNIVLVTLETHEQVHKNIDKCPKIKKLRQDLILLHNIGLLLPDKTNNMGATQETQAVQRELTYGEKAVGITFNPSSMPEVDVVKKQYAELIDNLDYMRSQSSNPEVKRQLSIAITEAQTSQMWAVKGLTWKY